MNLKEKKELERIIKFHGETLKEKKIELDALNKKREPAIKELYNGIDSFISVENKTR
ncbi:hypothetical protein [Tenacibaculum sp. nBUS_03]|uniref:hypothetical protein n=1 Tax=Tenacibaculum sp. nBUS_03 TaxID=3395320 RepID=UPI003EBCE273